VRRCAGSRDCAWIVTAISRQVLAGFGIGALFVLPGQPQPDWPSHTVQPGFVYFDRQGPQADSSSPELTAFLASGPAPIVFSLGSTAVHNPGDFYEASVEATKRLVPARAAAGIECGAAGRLAGDSGVAVCSVLPSLSSCSRDRASGRVGNHRPGAAGRATHAHRPLRLDQPDNAARVERLGVGCMCRGANIRPGPQQRRWSGCWEIRVLLRGRRRLVRKCSGRWTDRGLRCD